MPLLLLNSTHWQPQLLIQTQHPPCSFILCLIATSLQEPLLPSHLGFPGDKIPYPFPTAHLGILSYPISIPFCHPPEKHPLARDHSYHTLLQSREGNRNLGTEHTPNNGPAHNGPTMDQPTMEKQWTSWIATPITTSGVIIPNA